MNQGTLRDRYEIYLEKANDGKGGDITRNGRPLLTFDQWLNGVDDDDGDDE